MSDRDSWATPKWLTDLLPHVDLDPCSNARSTVRARQAYSLDSGQDGLALPWSGSVFVNPPFSDIMPWAEKAANSDTTALGFLVNVDSSTQWWSTLTRLLPYAFLFARRIQFSPPPGIPASTNSKPQALLCDLRFWAMCDREIEHHGRLWRVA